jgi:hypothetical protein
MKGYVDDIETRTEENADFRRVLYTGKNMQLVLMSLRPGEEIGEEVHSDRDQFFRIEVGEGEVWIDGKNTSKHTPVVDFKVPCGKHKIAFKRTDMQIDQTESFTVKAGQNFKQRYTLATDD